ncbi:MAG: hypothetical protein WEB30_08575 [Cyclobacteriaceae bacterium]
MRINSIGSLALKLGLVAMLGCGVDDEQLILDQRLAKLEFGIESQELNAAQNFSGLDALTWSDPVWLGPVVNSTARDWRPLLSTDGLRLYFHSDRDGGFDIWMSRREGPNCPWQPPVKMGPPVSTSEYHEGDPEFTPDGRVMFFSRDGAPDSEGIGDLFLSRQTDPNDDLAWDEPVNLGPHVNTAEHESNPCYVAAESGGTLYFSRSAEGSPPTGDIYKVSMSRDGRTSGPAVFVTELNEPVPIGDHAPTVRADGRELIFWSGGAAGSRPGGVGLADLWVSTRQSVNDPWSAPRNLGMPVNSPFAELSATLSHDGRMLFFTSARPGGLGLQDMWMSTRGPSAGKEEVASSSTQCPPLTH